MKKGKRYTEAAKLIEKTNVYDLNEADLALTDVMQISRFVVR